MSLGAAVVALLVGTVLGSLAVAAAAVPGAHTGAPSMVLLRGLFGTKSSYLPTVLNVVQLLGWTTFELVTIGTAMHQVASTIPRWVYVLAAGVLTTVLALRPLGWIRVLRKYVTLAVVVALVYLFVQLLRHPLPAFGDGSWHGFWIAVDTVIGVSVSWVPLASDYSRHARSAREAFTGAFVGYSDHPDRLLRARPGRAGHGRAPRRRTGSSARSWPCRWAPWPSPCSPIRELDQSFADTYSTAVSVQNFRPRWDRRVLALVVGTVATVCALALNISDYENFLILIGSVFVPAARRARRRLLRDLADAVVARAGRGHPLGHAGAVGGWASAPTSWSTRATSRWWSQWWGDVQSWLHFTPATWMSASLISFAVAAVATLPAGVVGLVGRRRVPEC